MVDERLLGEVIQNETIKIGTEEYRLWLVGLCETPNNAVLLAVTISGTEERLQLCLSDELRGDPFALRQRVVYFAKRIITNTRPQATTRLAA
jgi:hypothetical protein